VSRTVARTGSGRMGVRIGSEGICVMDIRDYNRRAWDRYVEAGDEFTRPVDGELIEYARRGEYAIFLTPFRPAPQNWFPNVRGLRVPVPGGGWRPAGPGSGGSRGGHHGPGYLP
jgi:hypothetical protein